MKALELVGEVDEQRQLHAALPAYATPGTVRVLVLWPEVEESEAALHADWMTASRASLQEVWDNEEDAIYDELPAR